MTAKLNQVIRIVNGGASCHMVPWESEVHVHSRKKKFKQNKSVKSY